MPMIAASVAGNPLGSDTMQHEALQNVLLSAIRGPGEGLGSTDRVNKLFAEHGAGAAEAQKLASAQAVEGFSLYRALVLGRFKSAIRAAIPQTVSVLGPTRFTAGVEAFIASEASSSRYVRDMASEFLHWATPRWRIDDDAPDFLVDLARYELLSFAVAAALDDLEPVRLAVDIDAALSFSRSTRLLRLSHAVHRRTSDLSASRPPASGTFCLLAYRDAQAQVRQLELSQLGAEVVEQLLDGATLRDATLQACRTFDQAADDITLASIATLLGDLQARGVILS